jgi:hypothetical protein
MSGPIDATRSALDRLRAAPGPARNPDARAARTRGGRDRSAEASGGTGALEWNINARDHLYRHT